MAYLQFTGSSNNSKSNSVTVVHPNGSFQTVKAWLPDDSTRSQTIEYIRKLMATNGMDFGLRTDSSGKVLVESIDKVSNSETHYWELEWNEAHSGFSIDEILKMRGQNILLRYVPRFPKRYKN